MIEPTFEPAFNAFISHVESFRVLLTGAPMVHTFDCPHLVACRSPPYPSHGRACCSPTLPSLIYISTTSDWGAWSFSVLFKACFGLHACMPMAPSPCPPHLSTFLCRPIAHVVMCR